MLPAFLRILALASLLALLIAAASPAGTPRFETALMPATGFTPSELTRHQTAVTGATKVRLIEFWRQIAPAREPASWDPRDPADPAYRWAGVDAQVQRAVKAGLDPILSIVMAPEWATAPGGGNYTAGTYEPSPSDFGRFALAAARRYSGAFEDLPRVRYWQAWNEPNLNLHLNPQLANGNPVSPGWYRGMVNAFADAVHSIHRDNIVVAGGLAPFFDNSPEVTRQNPDWGPLTFMRTLLCISKDLKPTCNDRVRFDVWSTHPYTSGGPTHQAVKPDDVSLGDLPEMRAILDAAIGARHIVSAHRPQFWVTEFSWDSKPPDPAGVPTKLLKRWVPQALYEMWRNGVSLVTWFSLHDESPTVSPYQSALFYAGGRAKPYLRGFRFPLVAFPRARGVYVWGRTPAGVRDRVIVERLAPGGAWRRLGTVATTRFGVFERTFRAQKTGWIRARIAGGDASLPFSLTPVPDQFFNPFGLPNLLEPKKK
jgi:hypothetical protein